MAVQHPLRVAGGAARVAHARRTVLVVDVELDRIGRSQEFLVVEEIVTRQVVGDLTRSVVHQDEVAQVLERREQRGQQREQRTVDEDHLVVRVVDDVRDLFREQADVQRVEHPAGARCGEVEFEVASCVPRERRDTTVGGDAEPIENTAETTGPLGPRPVRGPLAAGAGRGHDRLVPVIPLGPIEEVGNGEWDVLHQAAHASNVAAGGRSFRADARCAKLWPAGDRDGIMRHTTPGPQRAALHNRDLIRHLLGLQFAVMAEWAVFLGVLVYAFDKGGSGAVGTASIAMLVPTVAIAPFAGTLPERYRPQRVRVGGIVLQGIGYGVGAGLAFADAHYVLVLGAVTVGLGAVTTLRPAGAVLLPALVRSSRELVVGNVWSGHCENLSSLVGPLLATGLLVVGGAPAVIAGCAAAAVVSTIVTILPELVDPPAARTGDERVTAVALMRRNLRDLLKRPGLDGVLIVATSQYVVIGAMDVLVVIIAKDRLDLGESGPGVLLTLFGVGALVGGAVGSAFLRRDRLAPVMLAGMLVIAACVALFGLTVSLVAAVVLLPTIGISQATVDLMADVLLHRSAPPEALGSVFAALEVSGGLGMIVGALAVQILVGVSGVEAALFGIAAFFMVMAIVTARALRVADDSADVPVVQMSLLRRLPVFAVLPRPELEVVARSAVEVATERGDVVITQGDEGDRFYAVADGEFDVAIDDEHVQTVGRGGGFGEIALLADAPRAATVTCSTAGTMFAIGRRPFLLAVTGHDSSRQAAWGHIRSMQGDQASVDGPEQFVTITDQHDDR